MPIDFPSSPTVDQTVSLGAKKYQWTGEQWAAHNTSEDLLTLINELSTNMQNIGNYPYLEYAWVTAPNADGQLITGDTASTTPVALNITTKTQDTHNLVTQAVAGNQFRVPAGTYEFQTEVHFGYGSLYAGDIILYLYDATNSSYISKIKRGSAGYDGGSAGTIHSGRFKITQDCDLQVRVLVADSTTVGVNYANSTKLVATMNDGDQRTTIKLWKVG